MLVDSEIRSYILGGKCVKCEAMKDLTKLNGENWCFDCLWMRRDVLEKRNEVGEDVSRELKKVRDTTRILEWGMELPECEIRGV